MFSSYKGENIILGLTESNGGIHINEIIMPNDCRMIAPINAKNTLNNEPWFRLVRSGKLWKSFRAEIGRWRRQCARLKEHTPKGPRKHEMIQGNKRKCSKRKEVKWKMSLERWVWFKSCWVTIQLSSKPRHIWAKMGTILIIMLG